MKYDKPHITSNHIDDSQKQMAFRWQMNDDMWLTQDATGFDAIHNAALLVIEWDEKQMRIEWNDLVLINIFI